MARTAITPSVFTPNAKFANPAGTTVDPTNGHIVSGVPLEELVLYVDATFAGAKDYTVVAGANPPALSAGQGNLVISLNAEKAWIGPFESARFIQADGSLWLNVAASATGTVTAFRMPRTV